MTEEEHVIVALVERAFPFPVALLTLGGVCDELVRHDLNARDVLLRRLHKILKASDRGWKRVVFRRMLKDWNTLRHTRWAEDNTLADLMAADADGEAHTVLLQSALMLHGVWLELHRSGGRWTEVAGRNVDE